MGKLCQLGVCECWATAGTLCRDPKVQGMTYGAVSPLHPVAIRYLNKPQGLRLSIELTVKPGLGPYIPTSWSTIGWSGDVTGLHLRCCFWDGIVWAALEQGFVGKLENGLKCLSVMCLNNSGNLQNAICLVLFLFHPWINAIDPSDSMAVTLSASAAQF